MVSGPPAASYVGVGVDAVAWRKKGRGEGVTKGGTKAGGHCLPQEGGRVGCGIEAGWGGAAGSEVGSDIFGPGNWAGEGWVVWV